MATMKQASIKRQVGYAQVVTKTDEEIVRLRYHRTTAHDTIIQAQQELEDIDARLAATQEQLAYTQRVQAELERSVTQARQYAERAVDTLAEQEKQAALQEATRQHEHRAEITQGLVDKDKEETPRLLARKFDLQLAIQDARATIERVEKQLLDAEGVKQQAFRELGEAEKTEHLENLAGFDEQINELRAKIVPLEQARQRYLVEQALPLLEQWPEHVRELGKLRLRNDTFTAGLEGAIKLMEAMLHSPVMFPPILNMNAYPTARWSGGELAQLLCIPIEEIRAFVRGDTLAIRQRLERDKNLLADALRVER